MGSMFFLDQGVRLYQASILKVPAFDGTFMPVTRVPNWVKTGGKNTRPYSDYKKSELIYIPKYEPKKLASKCKEWSRAYANACATYTTVYMGNYKLDHKEYAGSHLAVDIRIPTGTPIYAVANGYVEKVQHQSSGFGNHIVIKHPRVPLLNGGKDTLYSAYAHLSSTVVSEGDVVRKGDLIAYSGNTGLSTTPHLHFQIDTSAAPWHPWWPFSSIQASATGLSFFQGVNAGLGKKEAMRNTINPLLWVQKYLSFSSGKMTPNAQDNSSRPSSALASFSVIGGKTPVPQGEVVTLVLTAFDGNKKRLTNYDGKHLTITTNGKTTSLPSPVFVNGRATVSLVFAEYGRMRITFSDGNVKKIVHVQILPPSPTSSPKKNTAAPPSLSEKYSIGSVSLSSDTDILPGGKSARIEIRLYDAEGKLISHPQFSPPLELRVRGSGRVSPSRLLPRYFHNGVAKVDFFSEKKTGDAQVFLSEFPNKKITFHVVQALAPVSAFSITADGFRVGKEVPVIITTLDAKKNRTLRRFHGTATISVVSGKARLSKATLTSDDFHNGKAEVGLTALSKDPIVLKVKSGVIVGTSKRIHEARGEEMIFKDVPATHNNADAISYLKKKGILTGNPDGTFRPNGTINRAEFAKMMLLALDINPAPAKGNRFSDVPKNAWYSDYVETAASLGIITGYPDGTFRPDGTINRAEVFAMIARAAKDRLPSYSSFSDVDSSAWYASAAGYAQQKKLLDFERYFYPSLKMTRAEVAEALARFMRR